MPALNYKNKMPKYKVKSPFNFFKVGDIVTDKEVSKYGPQYFEAVPDNKMMDSSNIITKDNVIEKETTKAPEPETSEDKPKKKK